MALLVRDADRDEDTEGRRFLMKESFWQGSTVSSLLFLSGYEAMTKESSPSTK